MKLRKLTGMFVLVLSMAPGMAFAANAVLSGVFDGAESRTNPLPGTCGGSNQLSYQDTGAFSVTASGTYTLFDVFNLSGVDISALIYTGSFDPANPQNNLLTEDGIDVFEPVDLIAGVSYTLVVQQWCENKEGAWALTVSGPGATNSASLVSVPEMTDGLFSSSDPVASTDCGNSQYHESGPMQVATSGMYYYTDISVETAVDVCLQVYSAPFDPADPLANRVGSPLDDFATIELEAGQDYYFVAQPFAQETNGEYFYVLAPPAPFRINKALAGGWFNPEVGGQGFLLDVYENLNFMFLAWFTFDLARPDAGVPSTIGEAGQRWLTAQGVYGQNSAELDIYNAKGMVFESVSPPVDNQLDGSMSIEFSSCIEGTIQYNIESAQQVGVIPIVPLVGPDLDSSTNELCESLTEVPGMPGPL